MAPFIIAEERMSAETVTQSKERKVLGAKKAGLRLRELAAAVKDGITQPWFHCFAEACTTTEGNNTYRRHGRKKRQMMMMTKIALQIICPR